MGAVEENVYGPYSARTRHVVLSDKELPCRPCYRRFKYNICDDMACLRNIKVADVLKAADEFLSKSVVRI